MPSERGLADSRSPNFGSITPHPVINNRCAIVTLWSPPKEPHLAIAATIVFRRGHSFSYNRNYGMLEDKYWCDSNDLGKSGWPVECYMTRILTLITAGYMCMPHPGANQVLVMYYLRGRDLRIPLIRQELPCVLNSRLVEYRRWQRKAREK